MRRSIYAYTPPGFDPPYVSINEEDDGRVTLMSRYELTMPREELIELVRSLFWYLTGYPQP